MTIEAMRERSHLVTLTRSFFLERKYIECETPLLSPSLIPESCLEAFATEFVHPYRTGFPLYLVPSPEVWMKRLIAETGMSCFQLSKAFRNAESIGPIHNPEFTMLEYYSVGANSAFNIGLTEELFSALASDRTPPSAKPPFRRMTMAEAFADLADLDLDALQDTAAMREAALAKALILSPTATWEEAFNVIFLSVVEPALPRDCPLVLDEYPSGIECLAKDIAGKPYKERWELYVGGMEVANCFTEMGERKAVESYFASQEEKKRLSLVPHRLDPSYPSIFENFPACSGVAIGFDRLVMALTGARRIDEVINFGFSQFPALK
jgi:lysyl-tRNA synthetase class 2